MNTNIISSSNGTNGRLKPKTGSEREGRAHGGYRPGGLTAHNKPTGADSQHTLVGGDIPGFAYWLRSQELNLYRKLALAGAVLQTELESVRRRGGEIFNGVWGIFERSYLAQVEAARQELGRLQFERGTIQHELKNTPRTVAVEPVPSRAPQGKNAIGYWFLWCLLVLMCASEGLYLASLTRYETQSWLVSLVCVSPFILFSLAAKPALNSLVGPQRVWILRLLALFGVTGFIIGIFFFGQNYGRPVSLDAPGDLARLIPDRRGQLFMQMILGFVVVLGLLAWIRSLELRPYTFELNRNWKLLNGRAEELDPSIQAAILRIGETEGRLVEYRACRESFIAVGLAEYQLAVERNRLINDRLRQLNDLNNP